MPSSWCEVNRIRTERKALTTQFQHGDAGLLFKPASLLLAWYSGLVSQHSVLPNRGAVAQLGERLNGIQEVVGSTPIGSTIRLAQNTRSW